MGIFWCGEDELSCALKTFGQGKFECKVKQVGGKHVSVNVEGDFDCDRALRYFQIKWDGTRRMLGRRGFECYLMLDSVGIRRFIGKGGCGIRRQVFRPSSSLFILTPRIGSER